MTKISRNYSKYPHLGVRRGLTKIFFSKVITHAGATFSGRKFFSKTDISGSQNFLGAEIRKIIGRGKYGQMFFGGFFFQHPQHTGQEKTTGTRSRAGGEVHMTPL